MLFIDYSSAFNTIVPSKLIIKLEALGPGLPDGPPPGGEGRKQYLHSADPQHGGPTRVCAQPPPVLPADNTTVVGLITNNDETTYREVRALGVWCLENNLSLNINKTKMMIVDFMKQQRVHPHIYIDGPAVEKVECFKFLGVHITDKLKWTTHTDSVVKKAQQCLFNLRKLMKCGLSPKTLINFNRCTLDSILSGSITTWYGNCTTQNRKAL